MEYQLKSKEYYEENKKNFNKFFNNITKLFINRTKIGCCSCLCHKFRPVDYQDFFNKYLESGKKSNFNYETLRGDLYNGRTIEELSAIAQAYCDAIHLSTITFEMCLDDIINHCIIETFDGQAVEREVCRIISESKKYNVKQEEDDFDAELGVDITVTDSTDKVTNFIQIKPISTFMGNRNLSLKSDRVNFYMKQVKLDNYLDTEGRSADKRLIEYMVYDKTEMDHSGKIRFLRNKKNNSFRFHLNELCDMRGNSLLKYNELSFGSLE